MKHLSKRLLSLVLVLVLCLGFVLPAAAKDNNSKARITSIEKVDNSAVTAELPDARKYEEAAQSSEYDATDVVRVSIVLEKESTIEKFGSVDKIETSAAVQYRSGLKAEQQSIQQRISTQALSGAALDVQWNLTLAANIISANVQYGQIEKIEKVKGVKAVYIETRYEPMVVEKETADPDMATSGTQIGSSVAYAAGYKGDGSKIAIIDTGIDQNHQSFDGGAFLDAVDKDTALMTKASLTTDVLSLLNAADGKLTTADVDNLYKSAKIPFGYNYIDGSFDTLHTGDMQGEHGSHVAGIAAANSEVSNGNGGYVNALETVHTQGVAPNAQLFAMKVFGKGGGAYDSDYMAAIEDAIVLGADSINLSLGSGNAGMSRSASEEYQAIMENLTKAGAVVAMSAGNSGYWAENTGNGLLYSDGINFQTDGSPGSFTNALTVASVDNVGQTGNPLLFGENGVFFSETSYTNAPIATLDKSGSGTEYDFVLFNNTGKDGEGNNLLTDYAEVTKDKVVMVYRGTSSFYEKHMAIAEVNGAACIVVNNQAGTINMDLSDSTATIPCVSITQADGETIKASATPVYAEDGTTVLYYTGKVTVSSKVSSSSSDVDYYTMSSFSSWGTPGSLVLKPEITAPGGNIYSVFGSSNDDKGNPQGGPDKYENMSGTSMASPQVAGMAALVAQYIREKGLAAKMGYSARVLAQSLLMSTAVPLKDADGNYYPVFQQGAGLANVGSAVSAPSYILMNPSATDSYEDGKVKVELGDDPTKTGSYMFSFGIYNLMDSELTYNLSADMFTQALVSDGGEDYLDTVTTPLDVLVRFGAGDSGNNQVTVPANGAAMVSVTVVITEKGKQQLEDYPVGAYIEGYVYATPVTTADGDAGVVHSIPVYGYYGSWTEASMFDVGTYTAFYYGEEERNPYMYAANSSYSYFGNSVVAQVAGEDSARYLGGNPCLVSVWVDDYTYHPERNAIRSDTVISALNYALVRNAAAYRAQIADESGKVLYKTEGGQTLAAYYYSNQAKWMNTASSIKTKWSAGSSVAEGTKLNISLTMAPEYYVDYSSGSAVVDWDALGDGATMSLPVVVDDTAPVIHDAEVDDDGSFVFNISDNQYVSAVALYNAGGTELYAMSPSLETDNIVAGGKYDYTFTADDLSGVSGKSFLVQAFDYACNVSTYRINVEYGEPQPIPEFIAYDSYYSSSKMAWVGFAENGFTNASKLAISLLDVYAATDVDGNIFAVTKDGGLYVVDEEDTSLATYVTNLGDYLLDMAYDTKSGTIYGINSNGSLVAINRLTGELQTIGATPLRTNTLAYDSATGYFYSASLGSNANVYRYKLSDIQNLKPYDFDGDGNVDEDDGQALLDYVNGVRTEISNEDLADLDKDGHIDSHDAYTFLTLLDNNVYAAGAEQVTFEDGLTVKYLQSMAWSAEKNCLYWAQFDGNDSAFLKINPSTDESKASVTELGYASDKEYTGLVIPTEKKNTWDAPTQKPISVTLDQSEATVLRGSTVQLSATVMPWTLTDRSVTWESSNTAVAMVNANGVVTGVAVGDCVITAKSTLDGSVAASCKVTVFTISKDFTGIVWDKNGEVNWSSFNTATLPNYTKEVESNARLSSAAFDTDGKLYGATYDPDKDASTFYQVDTDTMQATEIGDVGFGVVDLEYAPNLAGGTMLGVYYKYVLMIDRETGKYTGGWDWTGSNTSLVGIAYIGSTMNTYYNKMIDMYLLVDENGEVYMEAFIDLNGSYYYFQGPDDGDTGVNIGASEYYFQSATSDGDYLYVSHFVESKNTVEIIAVDLETNKVYNLGSFADGVWPVGGLMAVSAATTASADSDAAVKASAELKNSTVKNAELTDVQNVASNIVSGKYLPDAVSVSSADNGIALLNSSAAASDDEKQITLELTAADADGNDVASTNGIFTVNFNAFGLEYVSTSCDARLASVNTTQAKPNGFEGVLKIAYATTDEYEAGETIATVTFNLKEVSMADSVSVTHEEYNNVHTGNSEDVDVTYNHEWVESDRLEPTCSKPGYIKYTCSKCSKGKLELLPALGHQPTVDRDGNHVCARCGVSLDIGINNGGSSSSKDDKFPFTDVSKSDSYYDAVKYLYDNGIMNGVGYTSFGPNQTLTRAMVVTILYRLDGKEAVGFKGTFTDVPSGQWYSDAVEWAASHSVVNGVGNGKFDPQGEITREQLAAILQRYASYKALDTSASVSLNADAKVSAWATKNVEWAAALDLLKGGKSVDATAAANRAEVAVAMYGFITNLMK